MGSNPTIATSIMNRRNFLKLLGITAIAVPVLKVLPQEEPQVYNRITMHPDVYKEWEREMSESLVAQVRKRQNELVAQMFLNS